MSGDVRETTPTSTSVPTQLTSLVPTFDPAKDDLEQYVQKVEMLSDIWPEEKLNELATRLILNATGAAFQKLQLQKSEILINSKQGIQNLVTALGGHWGKVSLEKKYEVVEKALFRCTQKADETNDSFLARADIYWTELLSKGMDLGELRSYIVLRGSLLSHEDKKRVILECDVSGKGQLTMEKVNQSVRMLGSGFFQEMVGVKKTKGRIYDAVNLTQEDPDDHDWETPVLAAEDITEEDMIEALIQDGDEDACFVSEYESAMADTVQEDTELATAYSACTDARRRLSERFKNRGFWPTNPSKGKGKTFKGKGKGQFKGARKSLQQRIMETSCRLCGRKGHWKAECPERSRSSGGSSNSASAPTMTAVPIASASSPTDEFLPLEFMQLPEIHETALDEPRMHSVLATAVFLRGKRYKLNGDNGDNKNYNKGLFGDCYSHGDTPAPRSELQCSPKPCVHAVRAPIPVSELANDELAFFASSETQGILDTGATKSVIGSDLIPDLLKGLNPDIRKRVFRCKCAVTFRFGNQGTLDSHDAIVIPVGKLGLKIAIVKGQTPLLLSNTLLRTLKAQIDVSKQLLQSPMLTQPVPLKLNPRGLFLLDVNLLSKFASPQCSIAETFAHTDTSLSTNEKTESLAPAHGASRIHTEDCSDATCQGSQQVKAGYTSHETVIDEENHTHVTYDGAPEPPPHDMTRKVVTFKASTDPASIAKPNAIASRFKWSPVVPIISADPSIAVTHEPVQTPRKHPDRRLRRSSPGIHEAALGRDVQCQNRFWKGSCWEVLSDGLAHRASVGSLGGQDIRGIRKIRTHQVPQICRGDDRNGGKGDDSDNPRRDGGLSRMPRTSDAAPCQSQGNAHSTSKGSHGPSGRRDTERRMDQHAQRHQHRGEHRSTAGTDEPHGGSDDGDSQPCPPGPAVNIADAALGHMSAGDIDHDECLMNDFSTSPQRFHRQFQEIVMQIEEEFSVIQQQEFKIQHKQATLLEVFCSPNSELTQQVRNQGKDAYRMSLDQADLSTQNGRQVLFKHVMMYRPKNIWISPTCGPWSSWSNLNANRSLESFDLIQQQRQELFYQLALGIVLLRHQFQLGYHLHWEQPRRSIMFATPLLQELYSKTWVANFDMCRVGDLRDPVSQIPIQKSMAVRTTSKTMYESLHGRYCRRNHDHQALEGNTTVKGMSIKRTEFSERYPRKFARQVAKVLMQTENDVPKGYSDEIPILAAEAKRKLSNTGAKAGQISKRSRSSTSSSSLKRLPARLVKPSDLPDKRRRIDGKNPEPFLQQLQQVLRELKPQLPRVGKTTVTDPNIVTQIQGIFPDKTIIRVIACKGTERAIPPPKDLIPEEAPLRRAIVESRESHEIVVEDQWEHWQYLSQRQLTRPVKASHVNITVFAANPIETPSQAAPESPGRLATIPAPEEQPVQSTAPLASPAEIPEVPSMPAGQVPLETPSVRSETKAEAVDVQSHKHGHKFLSLPAEERSLLARLHKNLGHPTHQVLGQVLRQKGYPATMIQALEDFQCSVCQMQKGPKIARPAHLKPEIDFGDKVSVDGISWTNKDGKVLHFYHFLDHGTNYHVATVAPSRSAEQAIEKLNAAWINWAGPPNEFMADAATEFNSEVFDRYLQTLGTKSTIIPPNAHWQMGRSERHGNILQDMLNKFEIEHSISNYVELQRALTMCTTAKNSCSLRRGYSPDMLVFGKGLRVPGSLSGDDDLTAHLTASEGSSHGLLFRHQLAQRETARKAFHAADNSMAIRRAALRRERPHRGQYVPGEWVMIWRQKDNHHGWTGPAKVIQQDGNCVVFCRHFGTLIRAAPEHIRPVSAMEAQLINEDMPTATTQPYNSENPQQDLRATSTSEIPNTENLQQTQTIPQITSTHDRRPSQMSQEQPDIEPDYTSMTRPTSPMESQDNHGPSPTSGHEGENPIPPELQPYEIPIEDPGVEDQLVCDLLLCQDIDEQCHLTSAVDLAWRYEIEVDDQHVNFCESPDQVEDTILLATAAKKQRTEIKLSQLTACEREEFEKAKGAEISNWLSTGTVCRILRNKLPAEQVLRCRWIYTWKPIESPEEQAKLGKTRKAKARLVVLGYLDPALEEIPRDSPTLGRQSRMLILQLISSMNWELMSFDIKAAFLQGSTQGRIIGLEPPPEMIAAMKLSPDEICKLAKSAYGLIDAPYLWYKELDKALRELSFQPSPFDPTVYILYPEGSQKPAGIIGVHVDDGLCGGNEFFLQQLKKLETKYPFGSKKNQSFVFTGIEMCQNADYSITLSQEKYVSKIEPIHIQPERKSLPESTVNNDEKQGLRALIGSLQYASVNTRPDLASRLSYLQSQVNQATVQTLIQANKVLHDAKRYKDTTITVQPIHTDSIRFLAFSDASFSSKKQPDSHTGMMIMTTHKHIKDNVTCPVTPISWGCKKIQKVVVSTLSAEATSLNSTLDQLSWLRLFWGWLMNPKLQWKNTKTTLEQLPETIATLKEDVAVTDCKSLFDLVSRTAVPNCQEFRTQILARAIKDLLAENVSLRWVHSGAQLADALTKEMECTFLRHTLKNGKYKLHDEDQILRERATARNRIKWLQDQKTA
jgi:hypothetical protein